MAIVLSGHGYKCDQPSSFAMPRGFVFYFWTRTGIAIRDRVAGEVEADPDGANLQLAVQTISRGSLCPNYWLIDPSKPPLSIRNPPLPNVQYVPGPGDYWKLSDIMANANTNGLGNVNSPTAVHWCACRSEQRIVPFEQSLGSRAIRSRKMA